MGPLAADRLRRSRIGWVNKSTKCRDFLRKTFRQRGNGLSDQHIVLLLPTHPPASDKIGRFAPMPIVQPALRAPRKRTSGFALAGSDGCAAPGRCSPQGWPPPCAHARAAGYGLGNLYF